MQSGPETASQSPSTTTSPEGFAPLPLRARGTLEILDTAIKVYKQYFWVLMGWSALVSAVSSVPYAGGFGWIFLWPLLVGSCVCCITAAVRGQQVKFSQCSQFTRPRYGPLLGTVFFAGIVFFIVFFAVVMVAVFAGIALASTLGQLPVIVQVLLGILIVLGVVYLMSVATVWFNVALVVVCMEEGVHSTRAMGRSFELLRGYWIRVSTLIALLSLAMLALLAALYAFGALILGIGNIQAMFRGEDFSGLVMAMVVMTLMSALVGTLWYPVFYVTIALFYLDLRVRKEALDIEWNAHLSAQASLPPQPPAPAAVWAPDSDISLQHGQPSFRAALADVKNQTPGSPLPANAGASPSAPGTPPAPAAGAPIANEQRAAWLGDASPTVAASVATPLAPSTAGAVTPDQQAAWFGSQPASMQTAEPDAEPAIQNVAAVGAVCAQCGQSSPAGQVFCMNCGARLQSSGASSSAPGKW